MAPPPLKRFAVLAPPGRAEAVRRLLQAGGLLETGLEAEDHPEGVAFPVTDPRRAAPLARRVGGRVTRIREPARRPPRAPLDRVRRDLSGEVPQASLEELPAGWRRLGDVVLLDLPPALDPWRGRIAAAYGEALGASAVVSAGTGVAGRRRRPRGREVLWGDGAETVHREDGIRYHLDPTEVMFSAGNESERRRMGEVDARDEVVADLFAGVGYFTLPLALRAGARDVVAADVNPTALGYLARNAAANGVADRVHPVRADSRRLPPGGWADRAVLGYLPDPSDALPAALGALGGEGVLHHHRTVDRARAPDPAVREVREAAEAAGAQAEVLATRTVKSVDPGAVHVVVDARVG